MSLQKNVASQKIGWLMVDATDFATPETGITVTAKYWKDGGGLSTCSNTVSECTSGLYRITLAQTETNADFLALQMTGTGCADQWLIFYPEDGYAARISDIDSILADSTYGLDALETITSQIKSTIDGPVDSAITQNTGLISDVLSTIDSAVISTLDRNQNDLDSILADLSSISNICSQILLDTGTTLDNRQQSILVDTASILVDTGTTLDNRQQSILADTTSILVDTGTTLNDRQVSILADVSPLVSDIEAVRSIASNVLSTIDGSVLSNLSNIESIVTNLGGDSDNITSILEDTKSLLVDVSDIKSVVDDIESNLSNAISTLDGPIISDLSNIESIVTAQGTSGTADWSDKEKAQIRSALGVSGSVSALQNYGANSRLDNATYGLNALETLISDVLSTIDGPVISDLSNIESILENAGTADWGAKEKAQIRSALGISGATSAVEAYGVIPRLSDIESVLDDGTYGLNALETIVSDVLSTLDDNVDDKLTSILADTGTTLNALISDVLSTIDGPVISDLSNIESIVVAQGTSGTADWGDKEKAQIRSALGISGAVSALQNYGTNSRLDNATYGLDALETLISDVVSTLDGPVISTLDRNQTDLDAILLDTSSTLDNKIDSILADTQSLIVDVSDVKSVVDDVESNLSNTISTLDGPIHSTLDKIDSTVDGPVTDFLTSIVDDTSKIHSTIDGPIDSAITQNTGLVSDVLSTLDGPVISGLSDIVSTLDGPVISTLDRNQNDLDSLIVDCSDIQSAVDITKKNTSNKLIINESTGNAKIFADDDTTSTLVTSAFTSDATDTTRKQLR